MHVEGGVAADVERPADLRQAPAVPQFQQDLHAGARPSTLLPSVDEHVQAGTIGLRQRDDIARVGGEHEDLLWSSRAYSRSQSRTGLSTRPRTLDQRIPCPREE